MRILLAEDDQFLADGITMALQLSGHNVDYAGNGFDAEAAAAMQKYDVIILDLGLPRMDGLEVLRRMRERGNTSPVLVVTARDAVDDRVRGLDLGANDYLVKPFHLKELEARLRAIMRVQKWANRTNIKCGELCFDPADRTVTISGEQVNFTPRELAALELLLQKNGRIVTRDHLIECLGDWEEDITANAIDILLHRLRKKLEGSGTTIETHRGIGFSLKANG